MIVNTTANQFLITTSNLSTIDSSNGSNYCPEGNFWEWLYTFQPIYIMMVCITGLVGNSFVLIVMCLHKSHCTVAEIYLGNLAGADLLLLACLPFWATNIARRFSWPFGEFLCRYVNSVLYMNLCSSVYLLAMVSIDRYLALVKVLSHSRIRTVSCAKINCFFIWMFSLLMSSPVIIFRKVIDVQHLNISACLLKYPHEAWMLQMDIVLIVIVFLVPAAIISYCTFQILKVLRNNQMQRFKQVRKESKATYLVLIVLLVFVICWMPFQLLRFLKIFNETNLLSGCIWQSVIGNGNQIATFLAFTNSCINPILYVLVGKQFRKKAKELYIQTIASRSSSWNFSDSLTIESTSGKSKQLNREQA
ncbi:B2 bradykinin receptor-like [Carcharodon carcharias]|uniref:B2 bradykinin receptor-like n=1 Tax=Carcharodon carcharias TaxID=13397 RepID=UPI001B7DAF3D|nr:B2 bradykinin receptor-like [Carcharodon carcharias]